MNLKLTWGLLVIVLGMANSCGTYRTRMLRDCYLRTVDNGSEFGGQVVEVCESGEPREYSRDIYRSERF
mgnify:CR=1 FL=1